MSIFSFFNIKARMKEVFSQATIKKLLEYAKNKIIEQAKTKLSGPEKKSNVDNAVITFIKMNFVSKNTIINMLINILIDYVPVFTQCIYDYLKKYVDGITEV
ncbi:MAG: hypothetical protein NC200_03580 [Candidatus Gastranaerophilales bacterium]|nr:hypothetical protein [Candidatus Gastranaerophilales bacterium]